MDITTLNELLRRVKELCPDAQWDTGHDGNVIILTHQPLEV